MNSKSKLSNNSRIKRLPISMRVLNKENKKIKGSFLSRPRKEGGRIPVIDKFLPPLIARSRCTETTWKEVHSLQSSKPIQF